MPLNAFKTALAVALGLALGLAAYAAAPALAQETIQLPAVAKDGGKPLMQALAARKSDRQFKPEAIPEAQLAAILWAAYGTSRDDTHRTIPTSRGHNELAVYAVTAAGVYAYDPVANTLTLALEGDHTAEYGASSPPPLTLLYAAPDNTVGGMHAGSAYQNVGLYCASEGLNNVVKTTGSDNLKGQLKLPANFQVLVVQSIGQPG
jgi:hypothetical protein